MSSLPTSYNIARLTNATIEYKLLHPESHTKKTTIVLLYGLVCNNRHWEFQLDFFLENGFKVLLHNYRSTLAPRLSKMTLKKLYFKKYCEDIEELLEHLDIDDVIYVGHMGVNIF